MWARTATSIGLEKPSAQIFVTKVAADVSGALQTNSRIGT